MISSVSAAYEVNAQYGTKKNKTGMEGTTSFADSLKNLAPENLDDVKTSNANCLGISKAEYDNCFCLSALDEAKGQVLYFPPKHASEEMQKSWYDKVGKMSGEEKEFFLQHIDAVLTNEYGWLEGKGTSLYDLLQGNDPNGGEKFMTIMNNKINAICSSEQSFANFMKNCAEGNQYVMSHSVTEGMTADNIEAQKQRFQVFSKVFDDLIDDFLDGRYKKDNK